MPLLPQVDSHAATVLYELTAVQRKYVEVSFTALPETTLAPITDELVQASLQEVSLLSQDELALAIDT
jgi:hypothetical protein